MNDKLIEVMAQAVEGLLYIDDYGQWCLHADKGPSDLARAALAALRDYRGWIGPSERMPDPGVLVLALHDYGQPAAKPKYGDLGGRYGYRLTTRAPDSPCFLSELMETGRVIGWHPLPAAPQPEEAP